VYDAVFYDGPGNGKIPKTFRIDELACEGCGVCAWFCDYDAIKFKEVINGKWFESNTRHGQMVHARMNPGAENSGKLVSLIRKHARTIAEKRGLNLILVDGSPGIGCPVIASITGSDAVLIVTEPTLSGLHDMSRVSDLTSYFQIPTYGIVNKWDLNPEITAQIKVIMQEIGIVWAGKVPFDEAVTKAQLVQKSIVEFTSNGISKDIKNIWEFVWTDISANKSS